MIKHKPGAASSITNNHRESLNSMHNSMNIHHLPWSFSPFYLLSSSIQESQPGSNTNLAFFKEYLYFATRKWDRLRDKLQIATRK
jgi:hypothetical protein